MEIVAIQIALATCLYEQRLLFQAVETVKTEATMAIKGIILDRSVARFDLRDVDVAQRALHCTICVNMVLT